MQPRPARHQRAGGGSSSSNDTPRVELILYVSAASSYAAAARRNCETLLSRFDRGRVTFEICDVSQHPDRAERDGICFTPVLLKRLPLPRTLVIGDMSDSVALADLLISCGVELRR